MRLFLLLLLLFDGVIVIRAQQQRQQQSSSTTTTTTALDRARQLQAPPAVSTENGETESAEFWEKHSGLLRQAWQEWEQEQIIINAARHRQEQQQQQQSSSSSLVPEEVISLFSSPSNNSNASRLIDATLHSAVRAAWDDPSDETERSVTDLFESAAPGVYRGAFFSRGGVRAIRRLLDAVSETSGIPTRRPNGMNRYGYILDARVDGAVALNATWYNDGVYQALVNEYVRPVCRALFPAYVQAEDDVDSYAFTIRYKRGLDVALNEHSDASVVTMNINLNTEDDEDYEGSSIYFVDERDGTTSRHEIRHAPGVALVHRGMTRHAALPIGPRGERTNLVIWLFAKYGYVRVAPYPPAERMNVAERWTQPNRIDDDDHEESPPHGGGVGSNNRQGTGYGIQRRRQDYTYNSDL